MSKRLPSDIIRHEISPRVVRSNPKDVTLLRINEDLEKTVAEDYKFLMDSLIRLGDKLTEQQKEDIRNLESNTTVVSYTSFDISFLTFKGLVYLLDTKEYSWLRFIYTIEKNTYTDDEIKQLINLFLPFDRLLEVSVFVVPVSVLESRGVHRDHNEEQYIDEAEKVMSPAKFVNPHLTIKSFCFSVLLDLADHRRRIDLHYTRILKILWDVMDNNEREICFVFSHTLTMKIHLDINVPTREEKTLLIEKFDDMFVNYPYSDIFVNSQYSVEDTVNEVNFVRISDITKLTREFMSFSKDICLLTGLTI